MINKKVVRLETTFNDFFEKWLKVTKPFHSLSPIQMKLLGELIKYYYIYKKEISDENLLWKIVFDYDVKQQIRNDLNINVAYFNNILTQLRKLDVINGNKIKKTFMPELSEDLKGFNLVYKFIILDEEKDTDKKQA